MKRLKRYVAGLVTAVMILSLGTAFAAPSSSESVTVDSSTLTDFNNVFGKGSLSTEDIGRIWTDKTVSDKSISLSGDIGQDVTIEKEAGAEFQVALSALGSAADITDTTKVPTDTVFVLDLSNSMWTGGYTKIDQMIEGANDAIKTLMRANPQNRVAVVGYSTKSSVLLPLGSYQAGSNFLTRSGDTVNMTASKADDYGTVHNSSFQRLTINSHKYTQHGIYTGMNILNTADTKAIVGDTEVTRAPSLILMAEGEAKYGSKYFVNPSDDAEIGEVGDRATSRYAQSFVTAMTAAYMKEQVTKHYYGDKGDLQARVYTIGVNVNSSGAEALAYASLDPAQTVKSNFEDDGGDKTNPTASWTLDYFKEKFDDYHKYGTAAIHTGSNAGGLTGWNEVNITKADNNNATIDKFEYNDQYYEVENANWDEIFSQIADDVNHNAPSMPTDVDEGASGTGGESGKLVFTDRLNAYMSVSGLPTIVFAGNKYEAVSAEAEGNVTKYTFEGDVTGNEVYGDANLSGIKLIAEQEGDYQTLTWEIPANLLPLRTLKVESSTDENGKTSYTIAEKKKAYPIRLFYSVEKDKDVLFDEDDNAYILANTVDTKISYYAATWDEEKDIGNTTAVFTPAEENAFYKYTENTPLYVLDSSKGNLKTEAAIEEKIDKIEPGTNSVQIDGTTYNLRKAAKYDKDTAYFYIHNYYKEKSGGEAEKLTDYYRVMNTADLEKNTVAVNGALNIKSGLNKLSRVSDVKTDKTENKTGTASTVRNPQYNLEENAKVTIYLGNNGLLTDNVQTGSLSVILKDITGEGADENKEFTYTIGLYGLTEGSDESYTGLTGSYEYTITKTGTQESSESGNIKNGDKIQLAKGERLEISGLPAGSAWQLTQAQENGYSPVYESDDVKGNARTGQLLYTGKGDAAALDKEISIINNFDSAKVTYSLNYNQNAVKGRVSNVPEGGNYNGESEVSLAEGSSSGDIAHSDVDGKAVVFLGWYDGAQEDVNKIFGKDDKEDFETVKNAAIDGENNRKRFYDCTESDAVKYNMPARDVTLYAVWGYDENGDDKPDVSEETYTMTYDANGGYFGDDIAAATKTVKNLLAQKEYKLDYTNRPARLEQGGTKYAFISWTKEQDTKIYELGDERPSGISSVDIAADTKVYAAWGIDSDGDGTADINETSYNIAAKVNGKGGTIDPNGMVAVTEGANKTFNIKPNEGKAVDAIRIQKLDEDGQVISGETKTYRNTKGAELPEGQSFKAWTFFNVDSDYNITVTFADSKGGDIPDKYNRTLSYDANGGKNAPAAEQGKFDGESYELSSEIPTHDKAEYDGKQTDVIFIGWMRNSDDGKIYRNGDSVPDIIKNVEFDGKDITVYAAWGYDTDGDKVPDVKDTYYTVTTEVAGDKGGRITPENPTVKKDSKQEFTIKANDGYALKTIAVNNEIKYTNNDAENKFKGTWTLESVTDNCTVTVYFAADDNNNGIPDEYDPEEKNPNLKEIVTPENITGVPNGTSLNKIALPEMVIIKTTDGEMQAEVKWNLSGVQYDSSKETEQTFTITGMVTLPKGVDNADNISLETSVSVTVDAKADVRLTGIEIKNKPDKTVYTEGEKLDLSGLSVILKYSNDTSEEVNFEAFKDKNITVSPANETVLNTSYTKVTVSKGGFEVKFDILVEAALKYTVTVENGTGSGKYNEGETVEITADKASEEKVFDKWVSEDGVEFAEESKESTTFIMPDENVTVTATYKDKESGTYPEDTVDPSDPTEPSNSADKNNPNGNSEENSSEIDVKTGDSSNLALWIVLLAASAMSLIAIVVLYRRKRGNSKNL